MGDRRQVVLQYGDDKPEIFLYFHWAGSELETLVRRALKAGRGRWGDDAYLARILFERLILDSGHRDTETGVGMAPFHQDSEYPHDIYVHLGDSRVTIGDDSWSFAEYVEVSEEREFAPANE